MERIPAELLNEICQNTDKPTLLALRLTSHKISMHATQWAFRQVVVGLDGESTEYINNILSTSLRNWVHHFSFDTDCDRSDACYSPIEDQEQSDVSEELDFTFSHISRFSNLRSISLRFCGRCYHQVRLDPEPNSFRAEVLSLVAHALHDPTHPTPHLHTLSIKGLRDYNDPVLTGSPALRALLTRVRSLKLLVMSGNPAASPALHTFFRELPSTWLQPPASHLTTLHLVSYPMQFGFCPRLDLRGTHFPTLRVLALANYTCTHDWQFEWIQAHGSTLRTLIMDCCTIDFLMYFPEPDAEGYPTDPTATGGVYGFRLYMKRWAEFFRALGSGGELPQLREFRFGASMPWDGGWTAFDQLETLEAHVHPSRYVPFDRVGDKDPDYKKDEEAFEELEVILRRRREKGD
ncbi:hypothetical protein BD779DRAFT_1668002 [Infundibulicybe gibba]|nr:hypothetical protein BD779DRAFT_1668002 [Infundibulicybe gibba]